MPTDRLAGGGLLRPPLLGRLDRCLPWAVLLLCGFGLAIRLRQFLACFSYWYDEAYLLVNVWNVSFAELVGPLRSNLVIPPLFLWLERAMYLLLGPAEWAMRLPAVVFSVAALLVMAPAARQVVDRPFCWLAVVLCALSHHAVAHACEVRPYTGDLLMTELTVLAAAALLMRPPAFHCGLRIAVCGFIFNPKSEIRNPKSPRVLLLGLAAAAPWLSFPSVFVLGAASLALFCDTWRRGERAAWAHWAMMTALLGLSAVSLWWFQARHLYYPGLKEHWVCWDGFPENCAPLTVLAWSGRCFVGLGHYGSTGLGLPLGLLSIVGLMAVGRRSRPLALLLAGPPLFGYLAALIRVYPMADRTVFFAVPCLWLLAAAGVAALARAGNGRWAWAAVVLVGVLVVPQVVRGGKFLVIAEPRCDFRAAFAYVQRQQAEHDLWWVSAPEMCEVYCGADHPCLSSHCEWDEVAAAVRGRRVWIVAPPLATWKGPYPQEVAELFRSAGLAPARRERFTGLEAVLYEPDTAQGSGSSTSWR
jgi:hypothetical protein